MNKLLRIYLDPDEIDLDGYPFAWKRSTPPTTLLHEPAPLPPIKDLIREQAGHRCERCGHPYPPGIAKEYPRGEWTPCDEHCTHGGPMKRVLASGESEPVSAASAGEAYKVVEWLTETGRIEGGGVLAQWRILTTHHLNGIKHDCRWWNLAALCQRCHLAIQGKVRMERIYPWEHSEWFKPHAAGWYASAYLGEELSREETMSRLEPLLELELDQQSRYFGAYTISEKDETSVEEGV